MIETLGQALRAEWRVHVRCIDGYVAGDRIARKCRHVAELDLESIVWTRGGEFPVGRLGERLKCPRCGSTCISVIYAPPSNAGAMRRKA